MSIRRSHSCAPKCLCSKTNLELQPAKTPHVPWRCTRRSSAWLGLRKISPATTHPPSPFISPAPCLSILTSNKCCSHCARNRRAFLSSYTILKPFSPTGGAQPTLARRLEATGTGANPTLLSTGFEALLMRSGAGATLTIRMRACLQVAVQDCNREATFGRLSDRPLTPSGDQRTPACNQERLDPGRSHHESSSHTW